jgi:hypothetical protein
MRRGQALPASSMRRSARAGASGAGAARWGVKRYREAFRRRCHSLSRQVADRRRRASRRLSLSRPRRYRCYRALLLTHFMLLPIGMYPLCDIATDGISASAATATNQRIRFISLLLLFDKNVRPRAKNLTGHAGGNAHFWACANLAYENLDACKFKGKADRGGVNIFATRPREDRKGESQ